MIYVKDSSSIANNSQLHYNRVADLPVLIPNNV
jgi:hypothetical protein